MRAVRRYLLFMGRTDHVRGGWCDYGASFVYLEHALDVGESMMRDTKKDWWYHVVDRDTLGVVARGGKHPIAEPPIEV